MGPTELAISGLIALGAALQISALMDVGKTKQQADPSAKPVVVMRAEYELKKDCKGPSGVGPCIVETESNKQLGF